MRYKGLDLNLLVALDRILTERNVSRASEKLYRSQSTISGVLSRLREYFKDDLLVPSGRELILTPRGAELAAAVRHVLSQIEARLLTRPEFDPKTAERKISIFASDYVMIAGLADALRLIQRDAPRLTFAIEQPSPHRRADFSVLALERGSLDLLLSPERFLSKEHPSDPLFTESVCCLVWEGNTDIGNSMTLDEYLSLRHVVVSFGETAPSYETWFMDHISRKRNIEITAASFLTVPFLIIGTKRVALVHRRLAEAFSKLMPVRIVNPPFEIPLLTEVIQWHTCSCNDTGLMWVKNRIVAELRECPGAV